jgi:anti-sigma factor RsiW
VTREPRHPQANELQAWLDGDLSGTERQELSGHLEGCARCRGELASLEMLFAELETLETTGPEPAPRFAGTVMAEILRRDTEERVRRNRVVVPAAAAACFALVLALWLMPSPGLPAAASSSGPALPVLAGALLKIVHSGAVLVAEGLDLAFRLTRTASVLLGTLPGSVWVACLALLFAVHGALALCLRRYARENFGSIRT